MPADKIYVDSFGNRVPPNTYLRPSRHGLVYYVSFQVAGKAHVHNLHILESEPDSYMKAWNLSRKYVLIAKAQELGDRYKGLTPDPAPQERLRLKTAHTARYQRTLGYVLKAYTAFREHEGLSPTDRPAIRSRAAQLMRLLGENTLCEELQNRDLRNYVATRRTEKAWGTDRFVTDKTIRRELQLLAQAVKHACAEGTLPAEFALPTLDNVRWRRSPVDARRCAKGRSDATINALRTHEALPTWLAVRIDVVLATGLRKHELEAMRPSWIICAMDGRPPRIELPLELHNPQVGTDPLYRAISMDTYELLLAHIARHPGMRERNERMFPHEPQADRYLARVCEDLAVPKITWRDLRSTHAKRIEGQFGLRGAKRALRHASETETHKYLRANEEEMDALALDVPARAQK